MSEQKREGLKAPVEHRPRPRVAVLDFAQGLFLVLSLAACGTTTLTFPYSGFEPLYPKPELVLDHGGMMDDSKVHMTFPEVDSLQPRLRWSSFPGVYAYPNSQEPFVEVEPRRVGRVGYDLRIWRLDRSGKALVYERDDLEGTSHRLEEPLQPGARYLWTVRARFEVDGEPTVSEWSMALYPPVLPPGKTRITPLELATEYADARDMARKLGSIPYQNLFRFQTPVVAAREVQTLPSSTSVVGATTSAPQTRQTPAARKSLKVAIFESLDGKSTPRGEMRIMRSAESYIRRHNRLELEYSYYSDDFEVVGPGMDLWSGANEHRPLKNNVQRAGAQLGADLVLMYYYSAMAYAKQDFFTFEAFLFDINTGREYFSEGNHKNYKQETGQLFETVLRHYDL